MDCAPGELQRRDGLDDGKAGVENLTLSPGLVFWLALGGSAELGLWQIGVDEARSALYRFRLNAKTSERSGQSSPTSVPGVCRITHVASGPDWDGSLAFDP
jgi:hypothetical protein